MWLGVSKQHSCPNSIGVVFATFGDNTEAVAPNPDALQCLAPATEQWPRLTGQEVNVGKSTTWTLAGGQAERMQLLGAPILVEEEFRCLSVGIWYGPSGELVPY